MIPELLCSYSTVSSEELMLKVIPDYQIDKPLSCLFIERGSNDTYVVRCADKRYSLRIYRHQNYPRDEIDFEVDALNYLHNNGFPVAYPVARKSGGYITEIMAPEGIRYVLVTMFASGSEPEYDSPEDFRLTGVSVATLHQVSDGFTSLHSKKDLDLNNFLDDSLTAIEPHVSHRPEDMEQLHQYANKARSAVEQFPKGVMDIGFCHGDIHGGNAHLHNGVLTHFDFEECGIGYRVYDLATFKWAFSFGGLKPENWKAFVEGYESIRKIREADVELIDTFILVRHIWLIAFHMRNAHDFGGELTSDEYIDRQWSKLKSLSLEGIGAELSTEDNDTVVVRVIAGGPAAESKQLSAGDRITAVGSGEDGELIDVTGKPLDNVVNLICGPKGSTVRLTVLSSDAPANAIPKVVTLIRDQIKL